MSVEAEECEVDNYTAETPNGDIQAGMCPSFLPKTINQARFQKWARKRQEAVYLVLHVRAWDNQSAFSVLHFPSLDLLLPSHPLWRAVDELTWCNSHECTCMLQLDSPRSHLRTSVWTYMCASFVHVCEWFLR